MIEREEEINFTLNFIKALLEENQLTLTTKEQVPIIIYDYKEKKEYYLLEGK